MNPERTRIAVVVVVQAMVLAALALSGPETGFNLAPVAKYALGILAAGLAVLVALMRSWGGVGEPKL